MSRVENCLFKESQKLDRSFLPDVYEQISRRFDFEEKNVPERYRFWLCHDWVETLGGKKFFCSLTDGLSGGFLHDALAFVMRGYTVTKMNRNREVWCRGDNGDSFHYISDPDHGDHRIRYDCTPLIEIGGLYVRRESYYEGVGEVLGRPKHVFVNLFESDPSHNEGIRLIGYQEESFLGGSLCIYGQDNRDKRKIVDIEGDGYKIWQALILENGISREGGWEFRFWVRLEKVKQQ